MVDGAGRIRVKLLDLGLARSLLEDTPLVLARLAEKNDGGAHI